MKDGQNALIFTGTRKDAKELAAIFGSKYESVNPLKAAFAKVAPRYIPLNFNPTDPETKKQLEEKGYAVGAVETISASERPGTMWYGLNVLKR